MDTIVYCCSFDAGSFITILVNCLNKIIDLHIILGVDSDDIHWFRARSTGEVTSSSSSSGNSSAHSNSSSSSHAPPSYPASDSSDSDKDEGFSVV